MGEINYWNNDKKNPSSDGLIIFHLLHFLEVDYRFHTGQYDIKMTDPNWRYGTEVTNGTSNVSAGRCPKHNLPLDEIPTPPPTLTKGIIWYNLRIRYMQNIKYLWFLFLSYCVNPKYKLLQVLMHILNELITVKLTYLGLSPLRELST